MGSSKGYMDTIIRIGIYAITIIHLSTCEAAENDSQDVKSSYQRDNPYAIGKDIQEPETLPVLLGNDTRCRISEYQCINKKCVPINRFCDGSNDCGDSSDEPRHCTLPTTDRGGLKSYD